jgi:translation initiation factor 2 alpha subunit (eIF-2alpha)
MNYYISDIPNAGDILIGKITEVNTLGIELEFIEYGNKKGYILQKDLQHVKKSEFNKIYKKGNEIHVEFLKIFETVMSFSNKHIDEEKIKEFDKNLKNYKKIIKMISIFIDENEEIDRTDFLNKVLYNYLKKEDDDEEDEDADEENNHTIIIDLYNKIVKENEMIFDLEEPYKTKYYECIKTYIVDTKFKGLLKYESISLNSNGLNEIKNFYLDVIKYSTENEIELAVTLESTPRYIITFKEEKYMEELAKKIDLIEEYIKSKEVKFLHKLILKNCTED